MKLHHSSDPILQFLADYSSETLVRSFLDGFGDRRNAELRRLKVRMQGLEAENKALRMGHLPLVSDAGAAADEVVLAHGDIVTGQIAAIDHLYSVVRLGGSDEYLIPNEEFIEDGELEIEVDDYVNFVATDTPDGIALSHLELKRMQRWLELAHAFDVGDRIEVQLKIPVKGGYSASYGRIPVFIPQSHADLAPGKHPELLPGAMVEVKLLELDRSANRVVASRRQVMEEARDCFLASLKPGDRVDGIVKNITDFGAFVDLGSMVGLLHNSQMGPLTGTIEVGAAIETRVLKIDLEQMKISLTSKPVTVDAWAELQAKFKVGSSLNGKIKKFADVGVFVEIMTGISGLIFQSDFKHAFPDSVAAPAIGDMINVTIRNIDIERRRIALRLNRSSETRRGSEEISSSF